FQAVDERLSNRSVVLDEQECFVAPAGSAAGDQRLVGDFFSGARKQNAKRGSLADLAFDRNLSAALLYSSVHGSKPKAGSFSLRLSREEWLEDAALGRLVHPFTCIGDGESDVRFRRGFFVPSPDDEPTFVRHCVSRIGGEVENDLFELMRVGFDRAERRRQ